MNNPRPSLAHEARAFVIWRYASPRGWLVTRNELAAETGVPYHYVCTIVKERGWNVMLAPRFINHNITDQES
jgi:hypothetical protein